jgi:riboflavin kinase/FMN adenylyltransferase
MTRPRGFEGDIFSLGQKLRVFEELGVARTILIDFSENFSKIKGPDFLEILKGRGALSFLAVGSNFRCGYHLDTHAADIKKMNDRDGIPTELIPPVLEAGRPVSSSRVRAAITGGDLAGAAALLGRKLTLDLEGVPAGNRDGGAVFDMPSRNRITPPDGRYPAVLYGADAPAGVRTEISLERGRVFVPAPFSAERVEFV